MSDHAPRYHAERGTLSAPVNGVPRLLAGPWRYYCDDREITLDEYEAASRNEYEAATRGTSDFRQVLVDLLALHVPDEPDFEELCRECSWTYPCETVRRITHALQPATQTGDGT